MREYVICLSIAGKITNIKWSMYVVRELIMQIPEIRWQMICNASQFYRFVIGMGKNNAEKGEILYYVIHMEWQNIKTNYN